MARGRGSSRPQPKNNRASPRFWPKPRTLEEALANAIQHRDAIETTRVVAAETRGELRDVVGEARETLALLSASLKARETLKTAGVGQEARLQDLIGEARDLEMRLSLGLHAPSASFAENAPTFRRSIEPSIGDAA